MIAAGCKVTKNFAEGESLLVKNKINLQVPKKMKDRQLLKERVAELPLQKANKKLFYVFPVKLWIYTSASRSKENKFNWWLMNKVGEAPVIFKQDLANKTDNAIVNYLRNYGYMNAAVSHTFITKKKKTTVSYDIIPGEVWKIGKVVMPNAPFTTDSIVAASFQEAAVKSGNNFEVVALKAERDRVETLLRDSGYYFFTKDYLNFDLDSSRQRKTIDVYYKILQINDSVFHQKYFIKNVSVTTDFNVDYLSAKEHFDSTVTKRVNIFYKKKKFTTSLIQDGLFIQKNRHFNETSQMQTIKRYGEFGTFKFIAVDNDTAGIDSLGRRLLNTRVNLTPSKKHAIGGDVQANINFEGFFGVSATGTYRNKNLTGNADQLSLDLSTGVQLQYGKNVPVRIVTTDFTTNISYNWNRLLMPFVKRYKYKNASPKTRFNLRYYYQKRYNFDNDNNYVYFYDLHNYSTSMTWDWRKGTKINHLLTPFSFSMFLLPKKGTAFTALLEKDISTRKSYEEQILLGMNYTNIFTNQRSKTDNNFFYLRTSIESMGNLLMAGFSLANINGKIAKPYTIGGKPFSEYLKAEVDFRLFRRVSLHSSFASRIFTGVAYAYGNSSVIPFLKQFYIGGPNSMRGFNIREIGPGGYINPNASGRTYGFLTQTGDIKIELNAEYRFDMYKWLKGAIFLDVGNVWLMRKAADRPDGEFAFNTFWKQFAMNTGAGVRLDFNYFVIRLDYGIPFRDPSIQSVNKWKISQGVFQLGVGYPF